MRAPSTYRLGSISSLVVTFEDPLGESLCSLLGGKPYSPSGTLGSLGAGSRSRMARLRLLHLANPPPSTFSVHPFFPSAFLWSLLNLVSFGDAAPLLGSRLCIRVGGPSGSLLTTLPFFLILASYTSFNSLLSRPIHSHPPFSPHLFAYTPSQTEAMASG